MYQVLFLIPLHPPVLVDVIVVCVRMEGELSLVQLVVVLALNVVTVPDYTAYRLTLAREDQFEVETRLIVV